MADGYAWVDQFDWKSIGGGIWQRSDGKFHFSDETERFDSTPYDTQAEAEQALSQYCKEFLG